MYYCALHKWWLRMATIECGVVMQRAIIVLFTYITSSFRETAKQRLGGIGNTKVHGFHHGASILNSH